MKRNAAYGLFTMSSNMGFIVVPAPTPMLLPSFTQTAATVAEIVLSFMFLNPPFRSALAAMMH